MNVFAALAGGLLACCSCNAQPSVTEKTIHYSVAPQTEQDWATALHQQSPITSRGRIFHASTLWSVYWNFSTNQVNDRCLLQNTQVFVDITRTLPQMQSPEQLSQQHYQRWQGYYQALLRHEDQHKKYALNAASEVELALQRLAKRQDYDCPTLRYKAEQQSHKIVRKYQRQNSDYDITSHHGRADKADITLYL